MPPFKSNVTIKDCYIELIISSLIVAISNHVKLVSKLSSENQAKVYSEFLMHPQSMIKSSSTGHYRRRGSVNDIAKRCSITLRPERETDWEHGPSHQGWDNFGIFFSFEDQNSTFNHWMRRRKWLSAVFSIIIVFSIVSSIYLSIFFLYSDVNYSQTVTVTKHDHETLKNNTFFSITLMFGHVVWDPLWVSWPNF